jgi:transcriptional antiterminator
MPPITLEEALGLVKTTEENPKTSQQETHLLTPKQQQIEIRREKVITLLLKNLDIKDVAKQLGIHKDTVNEDFKAWTQTQQTNHLTLEWYHTYNQIKTTHPTKAFEALTRLLTKILEKQAKLEVNVQNNTTNNVQVNLSEQIKTLIDISERPCNANNNNPNP